MNRSIDRFLLFFGAARDEWKSWVSLGRTDRSEPSSDSSVVLCCVVLSWVCVCACVCVCVCV